ncbi:MAG TPA: copper chaperone PCu(A)C [Gammaproteobacteria bacterium]|nr:copper chaperone PCu(A)C [Gammaproteobacteria bacterium]
MKNFITALMFLLSTSGSSAYADQPALSLKDAWIAEAPPVSKVMVAYMTIINDAAEDITIVRAESELYSSIEFHETKREDGIARMLRHDKLTIPAGSSITLKRGGKHLMLFNPGKRLKAGDTVDIKLTTASNTSQTFAVSVKKSRF